MKVVSCQHGDDTWKRARLGIPTCSQYGRLITAAGKPSSQADRLLAELCAEWLLQQAASGWQPTGYMQRGADMEPEALAWYQWTHDLKVTPAGFLRSDDGWTGGTPDGFVGDEGIVEIKCNSAVHHIQALLEHDSDEHRPQCQGYLWLSGRDWIDRVYYAPTLPPVVTRHERDEGYIDKLADCVGGFVVRLQAAREKLLSLGCIPREPDLAADMDEFKACVEAAQTAMAVQAPPMDDAALDARIEELGL